MQRRAWVERIAVGGQVRRSEGDERGIRSSVATRTRSPRHTDRRARGADERRESLGAGHVWQILYHSTDLSGHDIAVSGLVLVPKGPPPAHGWPVAAWAHGTTGLADQCAPSIARDLGHDSSAVREVSALLAQDLAVVASDYPGLGTPGVHTYLIGRADARAVIDSVTAAHSLLGTRVSNAVVHRRALGGRSDGAVRCAIGRPTSAARGASSAPSRSRRRPRSTRSSPSPKPPRIRSNRRTSSMHSRGSTRSMPT